MNRVEIKEKAKIIVKENFQSFWKGYGIILAISILLSLGIELLFNSESMIYNVLTLVASCFTMTLSVGFYAYVLKMIRKEKFDREDIFSYIGKVLPIVVISLLTLIFTLLWSILFIIPGIIVAISYSFAYLVYVDNNELSPMECLEESKKLLDGYKLDYFVFVLSFIGWMLLSLLIVPLIYVIPYYTVAEILYYDELKKLKEKE